MTSTRTRRPAHRLAPPPEAAAGWRPAWTSALLFLLSVTILAAMLGGIFTVQSIQVEGNNAPVDLVRSAAGVSGQNIFTVRSDQVIARLSQVPSIAVERVEVSLPNQITIYIQAREAVVIWRSPTGPESIDASGTSIGGANVTSHLPIVTGGVNPPDSGQVAAVRLASAILPPLTGTAITSYSLHPHLGLEVDGGAGWRAVIGTGTPAAMTLRIATLAALLKKLAQRGQRLGSADLRYKGPYFRLAGS